MNKQDARWYCLSRDGVATLCADEEDAKEVAAKSSVLCPNNGPYRAMRLVDASAVDTAVAEERARCVEELLDMASMVQMDCGVCDVSKSLCTAAQELAAATC